MAESNEDGSVETFRDTYAAIDRVYDMYARSCGVSPTEFWCLAAVADNGLTSQAEVADHLGASRQTVNSAFKQLCSRGLVVLEPDPDNAVWEALPAADRTMLNRVMGRYLAALAPSLASLNR